MPVSTEQYKLRIGSFLSTRSRKVKYKTNNNNPRTKYKSEKYNNKIKYKSYLYTLVGLLLICSIVHTSASQITTNSILVKQQCDYNYVPDHYYHDHRPDPRNNSRPNSNKTTSTCQKFSTLSHAQIIWRSSGTECNYIPDHYYYYSRPDSNNSISQNPITRSPTVITNNLPGIKWGNCNCKSIYYLDNRPDTTDITSQSNCNSANRFVWTNVTRISKTSSPTISITDLSGTQWWSCISDYNYHVNRVKSTEVINLSCNNVSIRVPTCTTQNCPDRLRPTAMTYSSCHSSSCTTGPITCITQNRPGWFSLTSPDSLAIAPTEDHLLTILMNSQVRSGISVFLPTLIILTGRPIDNMQKLTDMKYTESYISQNGDVPAWKPLSNNLAHITHGNRRSAGKGLKLSTWNAGSSYLENKINEIEAVINSIRPHILVISESNLKQSHDTTNVQLPNYELFVSKTLENNEVNNTSRVIIYKHDEIVGKMRPDLMDKSVDSVWLEVGFKHHKKLLIGGHYRVWQNLGQMGNRESLSTTAQLTRWKLFLSQWKKAILEDKETIVMGDINLDWNTAMKSDPPGDGGDSTYYKTRPLAEELSRQILPLGVTQMVRGITRSWPGHKDSTIDLMFTTNPDKMSEPRTLIRSSSDHRLVMSTRYTKNIVEHPRYTRKRSYKKFDANSFQLAIRNTDLLDIYLCQDVNKAADLLTEKLTKILDNMAPVRSIQTRTNYAPWMSPDIKDDINARDAAQKKAIDSKAEKDWEQFKKLRNQVTGRIKKEKLAWQQRKLENCQGDPAKQWGHILGWLNWSSTSSPTKLIHGNRVETSPSKMANIMNNFYISKVNNIRSALPPPVTDPLGYLKQMMYGCPTRFQLKPVHPDIVYKIIGEMKSSRSSGIDHIDSQILKLIRKDITPVITHIINLSVTTACFPSNYKISKVVPLYKSKGDRLEPSSYRPVALLPVLSKILERVAFLQIIEYMENPTGEQDYSRRRSYIHPNHHGFRSHHSTATGTLQMYDMWMESLEKKELTGLVLVDMSAAFDCVDTSLLLKKLEYYGFSRHAKQWIWSYLTDRTQVVSIEGALSSSLRIQVGVPQGSILGPLIYIIFTNELPEVGHDAGCWELREINRTTEWSPRVNLECRDCGHTVSYADDSSCSVTSKNPIELSQKMENKYTSISNYLSANLLKVNDAKTHSMILTTSQLRRRQEIAIQVRIGDTRQDTTSTEQLLGLHLEQDLKFAEHILNNDKSLIKSLSTRLKAIKKIRNIASFKTRLMITNGIFMSKLSYLITVWGGCQQYLLAGLQVIQNEAMRAVCKRRISYPVKDLLKETNWLSVRQLIFFHSTMQAWKIINFRYPVYLHSKLVGNRPRYADRLAAAGSLVRGRRPRLQLIESSWRWRAAQYWDQLPRNIREIKENKVFKNQLKEWVKSNIEI